MYTVAPIYRDKELVRAAALTVAFAVISVAIAWGGYYLTDSFPLVLMATLYPTSVVCEYAAETAREYRGYRTRIVLAEQARQRAAVTAYHRTHTWR